MTDDPYRAPATTDIPAAPKTETWRPIITWAGVFAANLPVPLYFGLESTSGRSTVAMFATTVLVFLTGAPLYRRFPAVMRTITVGGILTAVSQFAPGLQLIAGLVGFGVADTLRHRDITSGIGDLASDDVAGTFVVTLITAAIVLCAAAVSGVCIQLAFMYFRTKGQQESPSAT